jgi:alpha-tubulin suppressor-like RCC1 family protein
MFTSLGHDEKGQLGVGDTKRRDVLTVIESLKDHKVVGTTCGKNHTLIRTGKCFGFGYLTSMAV